MNPVKIIKRQIQKWNLDPVEHIFLDVDEFINNFTDSNTYNNVTLDFTFIGPPDSLWHDQIYNGKITFPTNFPFAPPEVKFTSSIFHPNIYNSHEDRGIVCISILHEGIDSTGYESEDMRWSPAQNLQSIMRSIQLLFHEPNCESPANVDASQLYLNDRERLKQIILDEDYV
jgi:ubiquitin-protein ligase